MTYWPEKKLAEDHLVDLKKVYARLEHDPNCNAYRLKVVKNILDGTEAETKRKKEGGDFIQ